MLRIIFVIISIFLLTLCGCKTMQNSGVSQSPYIGQTFVTPFGMEFIENLPKAEKAPDNIIGNSRTVWIADRLLDTIDTDCINCLDTNRLITPIRVSYVPKGTRFKAVESYRIKYTFLYSLFNSDYDIIVIEDDSGRRSEVPEYFFKYKENLFFNSKYDRIIHTVENNIKEKGFYDYICHDDKNEVIRLNKFIQDFKLENDISILDPAIEKNKIRIVFKTTTSYLTYFRYKNDWSIKCD